MHIILHIQVLDYQKVGFRYKQNVQTLTYSKQELTDKFKNSMLREDLQRV